MSCSKQNSASSVFSLTVSTYCFLLCCVLCWVAQSCPILCNPMDWSPSGSSANGIFQARILEWVAMLSSRSSQLRDQTQVSHTARGFFTIWTTREAHCFLLLLLKCTILTFISLALSAAAAAAAKSLQSCLTLCNPTSYWNMGLFLGWVFQAQERQTVKERQKLSAPSAWALLQHKQGFPFFKLIPEDTDLWWTKILPPHVGPQEKPLRCSGIKIRIRPPVRKSVKCSQAGSWLDLVLQASWETWSHASLKQNSEALLFAGNAHDSSSLKPSTSSSILLSFLPMVGTHEQSYYTLQMESDTFIHFLKGLLWAPGSKANFFPTVNSLPLHSPQPN